LAEYKDEEDIVSTIFYKGYLIHTSSRFVQGKWIVELCISKHAGDQVTEKKFYTDKTLDSEEEAIEYSINFGKRIIDGKSANCTVTDL
jgi:hypothetical protein